MIDDITRWAQAQPDLLALVLVGSYARNAARPDSDIDLVLIVENPARYLDDIAWTGAFGKINQQQLEPYGRVTSIRVWYKAGPEVEFAITGRAWLSLPLDAGTKRVLRDGFKVLYESEAQLFSGLIL